MEQFLNLFFFIDKLPNWVLEAGRIWGVDMSCLCILPNFFNLFLHFVIGVIAFGLMIKYKEREGQFFGLLLVGIMLSGVSKFIDWTTNMLTATGHSVFFNYTLDLSIEALQFVGMGIIFFAIFRRLTQFYGSRTTNS